MLHEVSKTTETFLQDFTTRQLICELELAIQGPVIMARETKQHAGDESITCANRAGRFQYNNLKPPIWKSLNLLDYLMVLSFESRALEVSIFGHFQT